MGEWGVIKRNKGRRTRKKEKSEAVVPEDPELGRAEK